MDDSGTIYAIAGHGPSTIYKISSDNYSLYVKIGETPGRVIGTNLNFDGRLLGFVEEGRVRVIDLNSL